MSDYIFPIAGKYSITSFFGNRDAPTAGATTNHQGIDISVPVGTSVMAAMAGKVVGGGYSGARGNYIVVDHGSGVTTTYQHLSKSLAKIGEMVASGQKIALSGNSGVSTGPHLHYEIRQNGQAVDPMKFDGSGIGLENLLGGIDADGLLNVLKEKWYLVAGALMLVALLK